MRTKKQKQATWRNWFILKTTGIITELYRIARFCDNSMVKEKALYAIGAIHDLQTEIQKSKVEDWNE